MITIVLKGSLSIKSKNQYNIWINELIIPIASAKLLEAVICDSYDSRPDFYDFKIFTLKSAKSIYARCLNKVRKMFNNKSTGRLINLKTNDKLVLEYIKELKHTKTILFDRPIYPNSIFFARNMGIRTTLIAATPHPLIIFAYAKMEEYHMKILSDRSTYTNQNVIEFNTRSFNEADIIYVPCNTLNNINLRSFQKFYSNQKIKKISLSNFFRLPASVSLCKRRDDNDTHVTFLHVSFIKPIKGLHYLLEAWNLLINEGFTDIELRVIGKIDQDVKNYISNRFYSFIDTIQFLGYVDDLTSEYRNADVFVSSSVIDAGPRTIIESLMNETPVICTDNCGYADLIEDGINGFVYRYNDFYQLSGYLKQIICAKRGRMEYYKSSDTYIENSNFETDLLTHLIENL
jgi:glycosyltransferase involved in cell wall biosynthesis